MKISDAFGAKLRGVRYPPAVLCLDSIFGVKTHTVGICAGLTKNKANPREKTGFKKDGFTDLSTFRVKMGRNQAGLQWRHNTKNPFLFFANKSKNGFFRNSRLGENLVISVDNYEFLTLSTSLSTREKSWG